jgi:hypothetical protein
MEGVGRDDGSMKLELGLLLTSGWERAVCWCDDEKKGIITSTEQSAGSKGGWMRDGEVEWVEWE